MASLWISPPLDLADHPAPRRAPAPRLRLVHSVSDPAPARPAVPVDRRRVYLRRRLAAVAVAALVLVLAWQALAVVARPFTAAPAGGDATTIPVVVHDAAPGETLWSLAAALGPDDDVRRSVEVLTRLNGGSSLVVGQSVRVPAEWYGGAR
jgi:hypothetical protein